MLPIIVSTKGEKGLRHGTINLQIDNCAFSAIAEAHVEKDIPVNGAAKVYARIKEVNLKRWLSIKSPVVSNRT